MDITKLVLDKGALAEMGLGDKAVHLIEYDLPSKRKISNDSTKEQKKANKERNKIARDMRNRLIYLLKFKLLATQHLESCWIIEETRLESAMKVLTHFRDKMELNGFTDAKKRLRIIPILTTEEGLKNYEDRKIEFLLDYATEHIRYMDKVKKKRRAANGLVWRCKEAFKAISSLAEEVKTHKRYKELIDTIMALDGATCKAEAILKVEKEKRAKNKA